MQKNRIESGNIIQWIDDLLGFDPSFTEDSNDVSSEIEKDMDEPIVFEKSDLIKKSQLEESKAKLFHSETHAPFISKIDGYIQQKKSKIQNLTTYSKYLQQIIKNFEEQRNVLDSIITNLQRKERSSLTFLNWFQNLRNDLWKIHGIKLEEEVNSLAKAINDFKFYDHDAYKIVK